MLKQPISYEDFDGNVQIESFYFNLTKTELAEMQFSTEGGFDAMLTKIVQSDDKSAILETFKTIIMKAYGVRSEDGKRFMKSPQLAEEFSQTAAFDALVMLLANDAGAAGAFIVGVVPASLQDSVDLEALGLTNSVTEPTLTNTLEEPDPTPWLTEDRNPTKRELVEMSRPQLLEAMKAREERRARAQAAENITDDGTAALRAAFMDEE